MQDQLGVSPQSRSIESGDIDSVPSRRYWLRVVEATRGPQETGTVTTGAKSVPTGRRHPAGTEGSIKRLGNQTDKWGFREGQTGCVSSAHEREIQTEMIENGPTRMRQCPCLKGSSRFGRVCCSGAKSQSPVVDPGQEIQDEMTFILVEVIESIPNSS
ncbi:unnamed protein product [Protopolystoma xenopodis]|uniref:Uncharacterized protein n=1 Tax=Protopolystoma xenopodis TaxID=117903 RepID=A0A3S5A232_9PLAT|nr:unnamed protein product [Protopolystoma xenopodis]